MKKILMIITLIICLVITTGCVVPSKELLFINPISMNLSTAGNWVILPITITYYADYEGESEDVTLDCDYDCIQVYTTNPIGGDPSIWIDEYDLPCLHIPDLRKAGEIARVKVFVTYKEISGIFHVLVFRVE